MHLVARTAGAHRKYYYRHYEFGYWTPWEQIKLDIEDNPVIPVVWNDRLLLFWLRILKQAPMDPNALTPTSNSLNDSNLPITQISLNQIRTDAKNSVSTNMLVTVQAVLCWSEFYNGKWQPAKTSDVNLPTTLDASLPNVFDRTAIHLGVSVEGDALRIYIRDTPNVFNERGKDGLIHLVETWPGSFLFYNTHSLPVRGDDEVTLVPSASPPVSRRDFAGDNKQDFAFKYSDPTGADFTQKILRTQIPFEFINPTHALQDIWDAPIFFADSRHVFLVTTEERPVRVRNYGDFGIFVNAGVMNAEQIPALVVQTAPPPKPKFWGDGGPISPDRGVVDPAPMQRLITEDTYLRQGLSITRNVQYGDRQIGPSGAISNGSVER
jgi:hypothetical protein